MLVHSALFGQVITIRNERTDAPADQVLIYDSLSGHYVVSDLKGHADLSGFPKDSKLYFQHPSFDTYVALLSSLSQTVYLQEKVIHTEKVVVSANKWEQQPEEIPQEILAIEAEEIRFRNPATAAELLSQSGEVFVQKSQLGGGSPSLRGFAANSVLLVFDGVRMNNAIFRSGNLQNVISIDPLALEGVEVLTGSGSVIYGSDALGGVMDFHSVEPVFTGGNKTFVQPEVFLRYGTASNEKTIHGSLHIGGKKWSGFTSVSYNDYGDLRAGQSLDDDYPSYGRYPFVVGQDADGNDVILESEESLQEPTGYEAISILQKIRFKPSKQVDFTYNFYLNHLSEVPRFDRLIITGDDGQPDFAEWYYGPQKWMMHSLKAEITRSDGLFEKLRILPAYQRYEESRYDRRFGSSSLRSQMEELDIFSLNLDADKQLSRRMQLFYGAEMVLNQVNSQAYRENSTDGSRQGTTPRYPDGGSTYSNLAGYGSFTHYTTRSLTISGGIRYTHVWLDASTTNSDAAVLGAREVSLSNGSFNGNIGFTFNAEKSHHFSMLLSSGFRAPNVDDVGKVFELDGDDLVIPNSNLEPEKTYNAEASWDFKGENLQVGTTLFYSFLTDAIVRGRGEINGYDTLYYDGSYFNLYSQVNASRADIYGISLRTTYRISNQWGLKGNLNYTTGEERDSGEPLRHTTPVFGSLTTTWLPGRFKLEGSVYFNGNRFRSDIPSSEIDSKPYLYAMHRTDRSLDGSPGWYTINVRGSWHITPGILFQAAVENILDRHYRPYSSGISAPGRNIILSLRFTPGK